MNTHSDGLYGTLSTLRKERLSLKLESATPAVHLPVAKADVKQVREMMLFLSLRSTWSTAATLPLLLIQTKQKDLQSKKII